MSEWTGNDWWSASESVENNEGVALPVDVEDGQADAGSNDVDEKLLLAAGLPLLFGRKKKRDDKRKNRS